MAYQRILVFGAHPDDEITMAGTIAKLSQQGTEVYVVTMTNGCEGYPRAEMRDEIVAMRRQEAAECDKVLGIKQRIMLNRPDMGLNYDKETLQECIRIIRQICPNAIFTHGPFDKHIDHRMTHIISVDARWHAGEPVATALGEPWHTPYLFYYKGVVGRAPTIVIDVTETAHKRYEAMATQVSQHTLWGRSREEFLAEAERMRHSNQPYAETFWLAEDNVLHNFPPVELTHGHES